MLQQGVIRILTSGVVPLWFVAVGAMNGIRADEPIVDPTPVAIPQVAHSAVAVTGLVSDSLFLPYSAASGKGLEIVGQVGGNVLAIAVADPWLYVVRGGIFEVVDAQDPAHPVVVGRTPNLGCATTDMDADFRRGTAFLACGTSLVVVDARNPRHPLRVGELGLSHRALSARLSGDLGVVTSGAGGLQIVSVRDPSRPRLLGTTSDLPYAADAVVYGDHVLVAAGQDVLAVVDIADPTSPRVVFGDFGEHYSPPVNASATGIDVAGNVAIVAQGKNWRYLTAGGVHLYDISVPDKPVRLATFQPPDYADDVRVQGNLAFVTYGDEGLSVLDLSSPRDPRQIARHTLISAEDVRFDADRAYIVARGTVEILDLADIAPPPVLGELRYDDGQKPRVSAVAVHDGFLYAVSCENGLVVFDARDAANLRRVAQVDTAGCASHVAWMAGSVFIADARGGIVEIDVRQPEAPRMVSVVPTSAPVGAVIAEGGWLYATSSVAATEGNLWILDARTPGALHGVAHQTWPQRQGWIVVAGGYVYVATGGSSGRDLEILDAREPAALHAVARLSWTEWIHDCAVSGPYAYVAAGGLHVLDVHDPAAPQEVGALLVPEAFAIESVALVGPHAYVELVERLTYGARFWLGVVDITTPTAPRWLSRQPVDGGYPVPAGGRLLLPNYRGLAVFDIQAPSAPIAVGMFDAGSYVVAHALENGRFHGFTDTGVLVLDVDGVRGPRWIGRVASEDPPRPVDVAADGDRIVVLDGEATPIRNPWAPLGRLLVYDGAAGTAPVAATPLDLPSVAGSSSGARNAAESLVVDGDRAYVTANQLLAIYALREGDAPRHLGTSTDQAWIRGDFVVAGRMLYCLEGNSLAVLDVTDPAQVTRISTWRPEDPRAFESLTVRGEHAYVLGISRTDTEGVPAAPLWVVSVADPAHPVLLGEATIPGEPVAIAATEAHLILGTAEGLEILDIADPTAPRSVASLPIGAVERVIVQGSLAFATCRAGLAVVNVVAPAEPRLVGTVPTWMTGVTVHKDVAYVAAGSYGLLRVRLPTTLRD